MSRCAHRFAASGRQCRLLTSDPSGLCAQHFARHLSNQRATEQSADVAAILFRRSQDFQNAQGINHNLIQLYELLARDAISVRRAQTLAYITSLILRTLPAIDYDRAHGVRENSESTRVLPASNDHDDDHAEAADADPADASIDPANSNSADDHPDANSGPYATTANAPVVRPAPAIGSTVAIGSNIPDPPAHPKPS